MSTQFGKYVLQRKLAEGGMAELFLAKQEGMEGFEKLVVVKRILPQLCADDSFVRMFLNEARVAARLNHPNVVQIFDLGKLGEQFFIAMEYVHGEDLRAVIREATEHGARLPLGLACRILADAMAGLHYAHTRAGADGQPLGLVHRDVSPQNVLVTYEGGVKIVDFGIAKATREANAAQTQAGLLKGKYAYMSPEQARGLPIDARADVFCAGILLWEMVTWQRLFKRSTEMATLMAVAEEPIRAPNTLDKTLPVELNRIIVKALERNPDDRFQSAQELRAALEALIRTSGWEADAMALSEWMRGLFAQKLRRQAEDIRAAGLASLEDFLLKVEEKTSISWMGPPPATHRPTPSSGLPQSRGVTGPIAVDAAGAAKPPATPPLPGKAAAPLGRIVPTRTPPPPTRTPPPPSTASAMSAAVNAAFAGAGKAGTPAFGTPTASAGKAGTPAFGTPIAGAGKAGTPAFGTPTAGAAGATASATGATASATGAAPSATGAAPSATGAASPPAATGGAATASLTSNAAPTASAGATSSAGNGASSDGAPAGRSVTPSAGISSSPERSVTPAGGTSSAAGRSLTPAADISSAAGQSVTPAGGTSSAAAGGGVTGAAGWAMPSASGWGGPKTPPPPTAASATPSPPATAAPTAPTTPAMDAVNPAHYDDGPTEHAVAAPAYDDGPTTKATEDMLAAARATAPPPLAEFADDGATVPGGGLLTTPTTGGRPRAGLPAEGQRFGAEKSTLKHPAWLEPKTPPLKRVLVAASAAMAVAAVALVTLWPSGEPAVAPSDTTAAPATGTATNSATTNSTATNGAATNSATNGAAANSATTNSAATNGASTNNAANGATTNSASANGAAASGMTTSGAKSSGAPTSGVAVSGAKGSTTSAATAIHAVPTSAPTNAAGAPGNGGAATNSVAAPVATGAAATMAASATGTNGAAKIAASPGATDATAAHAPATTTPAHAPATTTPASASAATASHPSATEAAEPPVATGTALLVIHTDAPANIIVDGRAQGLTTSASVSVQPGVEHVVTVQRPGHSLRRLHVPALSAGERMPLHFNLR